MWMCFRLGSKPHIVCTRICVYMYVYFFKSLTVNRNTKCLIGDTIFSVLKKALGLQTEDEKLSVLSEISRPISRLG